MEIKIFRPEDCIEDMLYDLEHGKVKGSTTYVNEIDQFWTWRKGELNIHTGMANEGKSKMIRFLSLIKMLEEGWQFAFNSPEDFPPKEFYDDIIHTLSGKTTDKSNLYNELINKELYMYCYELIKNNIIFSYIKPPHNTIENALKEFTKLKEEMDIDGFILDPMMKFSKSKNAPDRVEEYSTYAVTLLGDFARTTESSVHLIIHQLTPTKSEKNGLYNKPNMYTIRGGGQIADGSDNVLILQRPQYAKDKLSTETLFGSDKIKNQKLVGIPGDVLFSFDRKTNRYCYHNTDISIYNFNKHLTK